MWRARSEAVSHSGDIITFLMLMFMSVVCSEWFPVFTALRTVGRNPSRNCCWNPLPGPEHLVGTSVGTLFRAKNCWWEPCSYYREPNRKGVRGFRGSGLNNCTRGDFCPKIEGLQL